MSNELEVQFSKFEVHLLQRMLDFRNYKRFYSSELARFLGTNTTHPQLGRLIQNLKNMGIIQEIEVVGNVKILSLNYNALKELYWNQKPVQEIINTFANHYFALISF